MHEIRPKIPYRSPIWKVTARPDNNKINIKNPMYMDKVDEIYNKQHGNKR